MGFGSKDKNLDNEHFRDAASIKEATDLAEEILRLIEEDVPEQAKLNRANFFESVQEGVGAVLETIEKLKKVTSNQLRALNNWKSGVEAYIH